MTRTLSLTLPLPRGYWVAFQATKMRPVRLLGGLSGSGSDKQDDVVEFAVVGRCEMVEFAAVGRYDVVEFAVLGRYDVVEVAVLGRYDVIDVPVLGRREFVEVPVLGLYEVVEVPVFGPYEVVEFAVLGRPRGRRGRGKSFSGSPVCRRTPFVPEGVGNVSMRVFWPRAGDVRGRAGGPGRLREVASRSSNRLLFRGVGRGGGGDGLRLGFENPCGRPGVLVTIAACA